MVDFTTPDAVVPNIRRALAAGVPCVVGTTGWDTAEVDEPARDGRRAGLLRAELRDRRRADDALRRRGLRVLRRGRDRRAAPRDEARRAVGHGEGDRGGDARATCRSTRCGCPGLVAHQEVILGGPGRDADDPPRHDLARGVRARRAARAREARTSCRRASRSGSTRCSDRRSSRSGSVVGEVELSLLRPREPEALLDEEAFAEDEFMPYWAELWPAGLALARALPPRLDGPARGRARLRPRRAVARRRRARRAR